MKKMTKIESARIIVEQEGSCVHVECKKCFTTHEKCGCKKLITISWTERKLALAEAYIKRHESKSKKKDHILDTTKKVDTYHKKLKKDYVELKPVKVTRPNFRKYLRDKIDMKVRVTPELSEELQKICFRENVFWTGGIKDIQSGKEFLFISNTSKYIKSYNIKSESTELLFSQHIECKEYNPETDTLVEKVEEPKPIKTVGIDNSDVTLALTAQCEPTPLEIAKMIRDNGYVCLHIWDCTRQCPISNSKTGQLDCSINRKQLIDDYISANEHVKDCPANSEIPQPIKLPDFVYSASKNGVGFIDTKNRTFNTNDKGELLINDKPCFATPEEALQVAKKLWNGEGK